MVPTSLGCEITMEISSRLLAPSLVPVTLPLFVRLTAIPYRGWGVDLTPRLLRVLAVADVTALDGDHADDRVEDGSLEVRVRGQADAHNEPAAAHVLGRLLERLLGHGKQQHRVRAQPVSHRGLHLPDQVRGRREVDVGLSSSFLDGL